MGARIAAEWIKPPTPEDIRKKGKVPKNGSVFFTIFQTFMSGPPRPYRYTSGQRARNDRATAAPWRSPEGSPADRKIRGALTRRVG